MSAIAPMHDATRSLLRELRDKDSETGLLKADRLYQALLAEIARSERYGNLLAGVLVRVRDLAPERHAARLALANRIATTLRNTDYAGTWQDDEFLLVLTETDDAGAREFAVKIKDELDALGREFDPDEGPAPRIHTLVAAWHSGDDAESLLQRLSIPANT